MIALLKGRVEEVGDGWAVVDVNGVGYLIFCSARTLGQVTVGDAVTWLVEAFNNLDGALYDADTDFGGTSTAMTGDATAKMVQEETLTLALADIAADPGTITLTIQPTDGTLGTDDVILMGVWLEVTGQALA